MTKDVVRRAGTTIDSPPRLPTMSAEDLLVEYYRAWQEGARRADTGAIGIAAKYGVSRCRCVD